MKRVAWRPRIRLSLTARISALLALAAIIPLLIIVISTELLSRPQLVNQAANGMSVDAHNKVQLIDTYLSERLHDVQTISRLPFLQRYIVENGTFRQEALDELSSGDQRDANYNTWSLLNLNGQSLLSYPLQPQAHGKYLVLPDALQKLRQSRQAILSDVFYDPTVSEASIDMYMPVITPTAAVVGILRVTLVLDYIWNIIDSQADSIGSYAFLLDHNGVRIGYTNTDVSNVTQPAHLFEAIEPLSAQTKGLIADENLYGNTVTPVRLFSDPNLAKVRHDPHAPSTFELVPAGGNKAFEVAEERSSITSWTYFALSPLNSITAIADQQLLSTCIIAAIVFILAGIVGLGLGQRITRPILQSVTSLLNSSQALKRLATKEEVTATEQQWVIESSQVGMQSVQYYTNATSTAAHSMSETSKQLLEQLKQTNAPSSIKQKLNEMLGIALYIEKASHYQESSNKSLATALRVTTQVTDQLASGAASATEASIQLEQVVDQLRQIVGTSVNEKG
jgi:hypothetical protein